MFRIFHFSAFFWIYRIFLNISFSVFTIYKISEIFRIFRYSGFSKTLNCSYLPYFSALLTISLPYFSIQLLDYNFHTEFQLIVKGQLFVYTWILTALTSLSSYHTLMYGCIRASSTEMRFSWSITSIFESKSRA